VTFSVLSEEDDDMVESCREEDEVLDFLKEKFQTQPACQDPESTRSRDFPCHRGACYTGPRLLKES
jgi:hypothetical protein